MTQINKQRENLGLAAIRAIIESVGREEQAKTILEVRKILKEFERISNHRFLPRPKAGCFHSHRWRTHRRLKGCNRVDKCSADCGSRGL